MRKNIRITILLCAAVLLIAGLLLGAGGGRSHVSAESAPAFGTLLADLVKACEDPELAGAETIDADLEAIRAVSRADYKIARSIAEHWRKVFLDPDYALCMHQGEEIASVPADAGIPNSRRHAIVILGYQLQDGQMQPELIGRCEAAAALARALPKTILICSGGATGENNPDGNTEAGLMKSYLTEQCGIDASRIFIDEEAMTTAENAVNTLQIMQRKGAHSMTIVTSRYHQCWGQADYNAAAAVYAKRFGYNVEIIGNYSYDIDAPIEIYKTGYRLAAFQIAGILGLPEDVTQSLSPFERPADAAPAAALPESASGAPDYADPANWAYLETEGDKSADVFLICPTVDMKDEYNMSLDDGKTMSSFLGALNMERGIYDADARMFAPYYRQAAIKVYSLEDAEREKYLALAYSDVSAAFAWYIENENNGRPIILAGFSQGADMCLRLLQEYFGSLLDERLVAVYAIGWPVTEEMTETYPQIRPAASAEDTGVVISFDCEAPELEETFINPAGRKALSINPLNWRTDSVAADKSENRGACFTKYSGAISLEQEGLCGCYIDPVRGVLKVTDVDPADYPPVVPGLPEGSYHVYDYQFFYRDLQENVKVRTEAFLEAAAGSALDDAA